MALADNLAAFAGDAVATKNRVDLLLEQLEDSEDLEVLQDALNDRRISGATLTRALRKEYGHAVVKDFSVDTWRRKNLAEVTGL